ncbi:MAG: nitrous oxide reductase family maturation protein NosD [Deltaproteobacteria bacterium]|nr:nitrous oxide reductase family maturation protein NosD [Deltaproteobacteria bacterium]
MKLRIERSWPLGVLIFGCWLLGVSAPAQAGASEVIRIAAGDNVAFADALQNAPAGAEVVLEGGVYRGNFEVRVPLRLRGEPGVVLTSEGHGTILRIFAKDVRVESLVLRDGGDDIGATDACIYIEATAARATIADSEMLRCAWGIWVNRAVGTLIEGNHIVGTTQKILSDRGNGIHFFDTRESIASGNRIELGRDGIYISNSEGVLIEDNQMSETRFGIHYMYSHRCQVIGNRVRNSAVGAAIMYSKELVVSENHLLGNDTHGILFRDVLYSLIEGNVSEGNADGLFLGSSYFNVIRRNRFAYNELAAHVSNGSKDNEVTENDFIDNRQQVRFLDSKSITWSGEGRGNYWSHYVGWDRDRNGVGDTRFLVTRLSDRLVYRFPILRVILESPSMQLLQRIENQFPVIRGAVIVDQYPLIRPVTL